MATKLSTTKLSRRAALAGGVSAIALAGTAGVAVAAAKQDPLVALGAAYDKARRASADLDAEILSWPVDDPRIASTELDDLVSELVDRKWDVIDRIAVIVPTSIAGAAVAFRVLADLREIFADGPDIDDLTRNLRDGLDRMGGAA